MNSFIIRSAAPIGHCLFLGSGGGRPGSDGEQIRKALQAKGWSILEAAPDLKIPRGGGIELALIEDGGMLSADLVRLLKEAGTLVVVLDDSMGIPREILPYVDLFFCSGPAQTVSLRGLGKPAHFVSPSWDRAERKLEVITRHWKYRNESQQYAQVDWSRISYGHTGIGKDQVGKEMSKAWQSPEIPARQRALVQSELADMYRGRPQLLFQVLADALKPYAVTGAGVLEIGCASGYYCEILEYLLCRRLAYVGMDYSKALIAMARSFYPSVPFLAADGSRIPFRDGAFPVVISSCVLLHVPNYLAHIRETVRVAGKVVIGHRIPICRRRPTQYYKKFAYGVETVEIVFNEEELLAAFRDEGAEQVRMIEFSSDESKDEYHATYVFEKAATPSSGWTPADSVIAAAPKPLPTVLWQNRDDMEAAPGGDTTVVHEITRNLADLGVPVRISLAENPALDGVDILQLNNISRTRDTLAQLANARAKGKPTVLIPLYEDMDRYLVPAMKTDLLFRYLAMNRKVLPLEHIAQVRAGFELDEHPLDNPFARAFGIGDTANQRTILEGVDLILTSGSAESESIRKKFGPSLPPMEEMHYGFNPAYAKADGSLFAAKYGLRDFVLCVGRLEPRKNQWQLIEVFRTLPKMQLVLIGRFSDPSMEPLIKAHAPSNVRFIERLPFEELVSAYAAARLHVLPSWYELPGLVSLEAAAAGSRVVSTDWGTAPDYLGNRVTYCSPDDPVGIRKAVLEAYESRLDPALKDYVVERFNWRNSAERCLRAYQDVLARR